MITKREITVPFKNGNDFDIDEIVLYLKRKIPQLDNACDIKINLLKKKIRTVTNHYMVLWQKCNRTTTRFLENTSVENFLNSEFTVSTKVIYYLSYF